MSLRRDGLTDIGQGPGVTPHFTVQYDSSMYDSLGPGQAGPVKARLLANANALLAVVEHEYEVTTAWFATPGGKFDGANRQVVNLNLADTPSGFPGARNAGYGSMLYLDAQCHNADPPAITAERVKMVFMAEWSEILMAVSAKWNAADSSGEALSHYCAIERFPAGHDAYYTDSFVGQWLNATPRQDWVNATFPGDGDGVSYGCGLAFLYYLRRQLGFEIDEIIGAGAATLTATYTLLTNDPGNPFPAFAGLLETAYPSGSKAVLPGPAINDPFPLASNRTLSLERYIASLPTGQRSTSVRTLIRGSGHRSLRAALNGRRLDALI